jgi:hypothetical protein
VLNEAAQLGFELTRLWAHAEFLCANGADTQDLIE